MHKLKICAVFVTLICLSNTAFAQNIQIKVTPETTITTAGKNSLNEGDYVNFKVIEDTPILKADDIVTGVVTSIEDNGFAGKEAQVVIENFRSGELTIEGEIYLHGNSHKKLNEFVDTSFSSFPILMRGGEVVAKPGKQYFLLYIKDKQ